MSSGVFLVIISGKAYGEMEDGRSGIHCRRKEDLEGHNAYYLQNLEGVMYFCSQMYN